jgi:hypothetical protein
VVLLPVLRLLASCTAGEGVKPLLLLLPLPLALPLLLPAFRLFASCTAGEGVELLLPPLGLPLRRPPLPVPLLLVVPLSIAALLASWEAGGGVLALPLPLPEPLPLPLLLPLPVLAMLFASCTAGGGVSLPAFLELLRLRGLLAPSPPSPVPRAQSNTQAEARPGTQPL